MEEEERQGSRSSQDKDTVEEVEEKVEEDRDEAGGSKVKKTQAKHDHVEPGKPKQDNNETGETCRDETAPREAMDDSGNKQNEEKTDAKQLEDGDPRNGTEMEEEENKVEEAATKRKVSRT